MDPLYVTLLPFAILKAVAVGLVLWWALRHPPPDGGGGDPGDDPPEPTTPRRPRGGRARGRPHGPPPTRRPLLRVDAARARRRSTA